MVLKLFILKFSKLLYKETGSCYIADPAKSSYGQSNFQFSDAGGISDGLTTEDETGANTGMRVKF